MRPVSGFGLKVVSVTTRFNDLAGDLLDLVKLHAKVETDDEDELLLDYIDAAIDAAENYLQKDIRPRAYELLWTGGNVLRLEVGEITSLAVTIGDPPVDDLPNLTTRGTPYFRDAGLVLYYGYYSGRVVNTYYEVPEAQGRTVTFNSGFTDIDTLPKAVKAFIYTMAATLYENRELVSATVAERKYTAEEVPLYLLQSLDQKVIA